MATSATNADFLTVEQEEKFKLITRGLQEVLGLDIIRDILKENKRPPVIYWGKSLTQHFLSSA